MKQLSGYDLIYSLMILATASFPLAFAIPPVA